MALTLLQRPKGYILSETAQSCTVTDSAGNALFTKATHGLADGDVVYSVTNIRDYNGFFVVDVQTVDTFLITEYSGGEAIDFIQAISGEYYNSLYDHGWSCVHLPITYKLSNDKFPVNTVDTARTVSSYTDDNGYVNLNLSGSLGTFQELDFIKISGAASEEVNGVFQVFDKYSTSDVTINLSYDSSYLFSGGSIQLFYSNYNVKINVYAGLNSAHQWESQKPYELIATLSLIPDSNNECIFSINEILKSKITFTNDTLLGTLPNNIDAFTQFYIEYAESYDVSNAYTITEYESAFTSDQSNFEGFAANAILPFKNLHSGYLSDYVTRINSGFSPQKWLTNFVEPKIFGDSTLIPEPYFDISFINDVENAQLFLLREYYLNNSLQFSTEDNLGLVDQGVIRLEIEADCDYDYVDLTVRSTPAKLPIIEPITVRFNCECDAYDIRLTWLNNLGGFDYFAFQAKKEYSVNIIDSGTTNVNTFSSWPESYGAFADTISKQTFRRSNNAITIVSQYLTQDEVNAIYQIKTSPLVQIINSRQDKRTVLVDTDSFTKYSDGDKLFSIQFNITYTDDIPSQRI